MKAKHILHSAVIVLIFSGCFNNAKNGNTSGIDTATQKTKTFYCILDGTVYTYQKFKIIDNEIVLNYLDMESYGYHISAMNSQGDSIMRMSIDKEIDLLEYDKGNPVLYDSYLPNPTKRMTIQRNNKNYVWEIFINDDTEPYKYLIIDSLDLQKSGYKIDTVSNWLEE